MDFVIEIFGEKQIARRLERFGRAAEDMRPAYTEIADDFLVIEREQFATEGSRGGSSWAPLSPATIAKKMRRGLPTAILVETDAMHKSLTQRGARGAVRTIRRDELRLGTRISRDFVSTRKSGRGGVGAGYPALHQSGTRNMPARPPVNLTEGDRRRWVKIIQRHLVESLRRV